MTDPPNYGYTTPPHGRRGLSAMLLAGITLLIVVALSAGAMWGLGIGPFAPAPSTPGVQPTLQPGASPSVPAPSNGPTQTPSPLPTGSSSLSATPSLAPAPSASQTPPTTGEPPATASSTVPPTTLPGTDPTAVLLGHVPPLITAACSPTSPDEPVAAQVTCSLDDGMLVVEYFLYATRDEMGAAYATFVDTAQIEPDSGDCALHASWPTENPYTVGGLAAGRYLCIDGGAEPGATPSIYWTDERFNILARASHAAANRDRLLSFWAAEAGPI